MTDEYEKVTAAAVLIGNELLSGSVADKNMHYIAKSLVQSGITLTEVRVIPDDCDVIVKVIRELRTQVDYVFTTGGIGPTHDDITAESIAKAFDLPLIQHPKTAHILREFFESKNVEVNDERMRMANMPEGAKPVLHDQSPVPGFCIENVYVMAGVPGAMRSMLDAAIPGLKKGKPVHSVSLRCDLQEGTLAKKLAAIQAGYPAIDIGSYPLSQEFHYHVSLVVRGVDKILINEVCTKIKKLIAELDGNLISEI